MTKTITTLAVAALVVFVLAVSAVSVSSMLSGDDNEESLEWGPELEMRIKQDYRNKLISEGYNDGSLSINDIVVEGYFGTYNGSVAVMVRDPRGCIQAIIEETVAGMTFFHNTPAHRASVWNDGVFYTLTEAYDQNLLIQEDLEKIHEIYPGAEWAP